MLDPPACPSRDARLRPYAPAEPDLCFLCRELTTGLCKSSSSLHGGPSPKWMGGKSPALPKPSLVHDPVSQLNLLSHDGWGSESRRCSLAGVVMPEAGLEGSGGGP
jgi:hypothetical protein